MYSLYDSINKMRREGSPPVSYKENNESLLILMNAFKEDCAFYKYNHEGSDGCKCRYK